MERIHCLALLSLCLPLTAQTPQFAERETEPVFGTSAWRLANSWLAIGDMDADGDEDLVDPFGRVFFNRGGYFGGEPILGRPDLGPVAVLDLDGDGDLDVLASRVAHERGQNTLFCWTNDGSGRLTEETGVRTPAIVSPWLASLQIADIDGDGDPDVVGGNDQLTVFENRAGVFVDVTTARVPVIRGVHAIALLDADADGDFDIATRTGVLLVNSGSGQFSIVTNSGLLQWTYPRVGPVRLPVGDVDGDGRDDVLIDSRICLNRGGRFVPGAPLPVAPDELAAWDLVDLDLDGDLDLLGMNFAIGGSPGAPDARVLRNDGAGVFSVWQTFEDGFGPSSTLDVEGDGDRDVIILASGGARLYRNDGSGVLRLANPDRFVTPIHVADSNAAPGISADLDGDGDIDHLTGQLAFMENDGDGQFSDTTAGRLPGGIRPWFGLLTIDIDGDGALDLFVRDYPYPTLLRNDGAGVFADVTAGSGLAQAWFGAAVAFDADGDGDQDLGVASDLYVNDGTGVFTMILGALPGSTTGFEPPVAVDVDGDRDMDLIRGPDLLRNDGSANFTLVTGAIAPVADALPTDAGDIDGDGDPDLVGRYALWLNDGTGRFTEQGATRFPPPVPYSGTTWQLSDFDEDGDLDVIAEAHDVRLFVNDGTGHFVDATPLRVEPASSVPLLASPGRLFADIDADGDIDIFTAKPSVYVNHHRQLTSPGAPVPGGDYTLIVHSQPGYAVAPRLVFPLLAPAPARIEIPGIGRLGVDPAAAVSLPLIVLTASQSEARIVLPVPNVPALRGLSLWAQAGIADLQSGLRLTNRVSDVIR